ncbi:MAG: hypothetical protein WCR52_20500 [Bacteroidota bacterium]
METSENDFIAPDPEPAAPLKSGLRITPELGAYLREISVWTFIFIGISAFFFVLTVIQNYFNYTQIDPEHENIGSLLNSTILGLLLIGMPGWFAYQFAINVRKGLQSESPAAMEKGFQNLRGLYVFFGIMTILYLGILLLAFVVAITFSRQITPMG